MNEDELTDIFFTATQRMHRAVATFHEDCYTEDGKKPELSQENINKALGSLGTLMELECDLIQTAIQEYNE